MIELVNKMKIYHHIIILLMLTGNVRCQPMTNDDAEHLMDQYKELYGRLIVDSVIVSTLQKNDWTNDTLYEKLMNCKPFSEIYQDTNLVHLNLYNVGSTKGGGMIFFKNMGAERREELIFGDRKLKNYIARGLRADTINGKENWMDYSLDVFEKAPNDPMYDDVIGFIEITFSYGNLSEDRELYFDAIILIRKPRVQ